MFVSDAARAAIPAAAAIGSRRPRLRENPWRRPLRGREPAAAGIGSRRSTTARAVKTPASRPLSSCRLRLQVLRAEEADRSVLCRLRPVCV